VYERRRPLEERELLEKMKSEGVAFIYLLFTDITGEPKKVTISSAMAESALKHGVWFDGSSIEGFARIYESDMLLKPDVDTFSILPWSQNSNKIAQIICDVYLPNETPFEGDPRGVLKRTLGKAKKMGLEYYTGPEIEFFLLEREALPELKVHDMKGYFDLGVHSRAVELCQETMRQMESFGVHCETYHHEVSHGQHEIDLSYDRALKIADGIISLKHALRMNAMIKGLKVTFMPKPLFGVNGSGMHTHQSLGDGKGKNLFYDEKDDYGLSELSYQFLAGQIKHARALSLLVAPTVNSYKRLVPGYEAPVYICWGRVNRSALIRIPKVSQTKAREGARLELRCPDPSCNPYLAFAGMLAAGLDGIDNGLKPPKAVEENVYGFSDEKLSEMEIATLPKSIGEAADELERDDIILGMMGKHLSTHFIQAKRQEWKEFLMQVTPWEVERYL
jgi:glutamine synthetase